MLYKSVEGKENIDINDYIIPGQLSSRGHSKKLYMKSFEKDVRKFSFSDKTIDQWNILPEEIMCVKIIHSFKEKYGKLVSKDGTQQA